MGWSHSRSADSRLRAEWSRQLDTDGAVELLAGRKVIARVDAEGVLLASRDLFVRWQHLGFADGVESGRLDMAPSTLELWVSRNWWAEHIATATGTERDRAERELSQGWARPAVEFRSWSRAPVTTFAAWLSDEAVARAPLPDRFCLSPAGDPVCDRDSNRPVPLDRLPISHELRARLAAWGSAGAAVPPAEAGADETWERFWPEGRDLAASLQAETGRPAAVWKDCPDVP